MIIGLNGGNKTGPLIECYGFDYKIIEKEAKEALLQPRLGDVERKVEAVNRFFATTNINDMMVAFYNGHLLSLVASFDLCYYHEIELLFVGLRAMDLIFYTSVSSLDINIPFISLAATADGAFEFSFVDSYKKKHHIICGDFDYKIELVKYFDEKGRRKMDINY